MERERKAHALEILREGVHEKLFAVRNGMKMERQRFCFERYICGVILALPSKGPLFKFSKQICIQVKKYLAMFKIMDN
jgi:hypothetical protein